MKRLVFASVCLLATACEDTTLNPADDPKHTLYAEPTIVSFDSVELGHTASRTFDLINGGDFALDVDAPALTGRFALDPGAALRLQAGERSTFTAQFSADLEGIADGDVTFTAAGIEGSVVVDLIARAFITPVPKISVDPMAIDFGEVEEGTAETRSFTVRNPGSATITVQNVTLAAADPEITMTPSELSETVLAAGESRAFELQFAPPLEAAPGPRQAAIRVLSDVPGAEQIDVPITGTAVASGKLCVTPESIDFGRLSPRLPEDRTVHVENCASGRLIISAIELGSSSDPAFSIKEAPALPLALAARGDAADITIHFAPDPAAPSAIADGTLHIASGHGDGTVTLHGERSDPRPSADCSTIFQETHYCLTKIQQPNRPAIVGWDSGRLCPISVPFTGWDEMASIAWLGHDVANGIYGKFYYCPRAFDGLTELDLDTGTFTVSDLRCTAVANLHDGLVVIPEGGAPEIFDELWYYQSFAGVLAGQQQILVPQNFPSAGRNYYDTRIASKADSIYMSWHSTHEIDPWDHLAYRSVIGLENYDDWVMGLAVTPDRYIAINGWFATPDIFLFDEELGLALGSVPVGAALEGLACVYNP